MGATGIREQVRRMPVRVANRLGGGRYIVLCDHASNHVPPQFGTLGLGREDLLRHIAWDPGALGVAQVLARLLDAPLVESRISRLVADCNRPLDAPDLVPETSETTEIPGNRALGASQRAERIALTHRPYHEAIEQLAVERLAKGLGCAMVAIHSFTPVYKGVSRPWEIGIIHDADERLSAPLIAALAAAGDIVVGDNEPYSPADRVYYTLECHARSRGLACVMIEIRNDEIAKQAEQHRWAEMLAGVLSAIDAPTAVGAERPRRAESLSHAGERRRG